MKKKMALLAITVLLISGCRAGQTPENSDAGKLRVASSFYPLTEFANQIGRDRVSVITITQAGVEPHDYEPSARDIEKVKSAEVFLFNGAGLDPWAEKIKPDLEKEGIAAVEMAKNFQLMDGDPHIWLDPILAIKQVEIIRDALSKADPENASYYVENAGAYSASLTALDEKFRNGLRDCRLRESIVSHDAFRYLAKKYNINFTAISGFSPADDPSLRRIGELAALAKEKNIKFIFFETLVSPDLAETIANETGAQTLVLNPLEGLTSEEEAEGKNYISIMEENLDNLRKANECSMQ